MNATIFCLLCVLAQPKEPPVPLRDLPFGDPVQRERFLRADAAVRQLLGPEFKETPYAKKVFESDHGRTLSFSLIHKGPALAKVKGEKVAGKYARFLDLEFQRGKTMAAGEFERIRVLAHWQPDAVEWKTYVHFSQSLYAAPARKWTWIELHFDHPQFPRSPLGSPQSLRIPDTAVSVKKKFGKFDYQIGVRLEEAWRGDMEANIKRLFASPDAFRDLALENLDRLEKAIDDGIATGDAIKQYGQPKGRPGLPPESGELMKPTHDLTPLQKKEVRAELLAHVEHQRRIIRDQFRALHASLRTAFPLDEVLANRK